MSTIKIFLASSEELIDDRNAFGNLVRRLDKLYEKRGIRIELFEWEDYDAAYNNRRKQNEYNNQIKTSDMFLALFHTKAGKFTIEEFNLATEEFKKHASPKVYTYCKDLRPGEQESPELTEFKRRLFEEMGHYWSRYNNRDSMQLHFVMQLQLVETSGVVEKMKLEDGIVVLEGMPIAKIDNLQFAACNEAYQKMSTELAILPEKIEQAHLRFEKFPDDEDLRDDWQQKLNRYNQLRDEFAQLQKSLFETAQRITAMQLEQVSEMLRRAIEAFEEGNLERSNTLLDEISHEAERHMEQLELNRTLVHQDIEAFLLQAKILLADTNIPVGIRINRVSSIYEKVDDWAAKSALDEKKYVAFLFDYAIFLYDYALYEESLQMWKREISLSETLYGGQDLFTARSYHNIARAYGCIGDYTEEMKFYQKALIIREKSLGIYHPDTASSYNNIGCCYEDQKDFQKALEFFNKALTIRLEVLGERHLYTAASYNNIGEVYYYLGKFDVALHNYQTALKIFIETVGEKHSYTATSYKNVGKVYEDMGYNSKALAKYKKALNIYENVLGSLHPDTAQIYSDIGGIYIRMVDLSNALLFYKKAYEVYKAKNDKEKMLRQEEKITMINNFKINDIIK